MIIVDTNVMVAEALERLPVDLRAMDNEWVSSPLWRSEFRSALAQMMRTQGMQVEEANRLFDVAAQGVIEFLPETPRVLALVPTSPCSAYDLEFVAVAMQLGVPLVTYDRQVLASFPALALTPERFAAAR